jgi:hypothetical protein
MDDREIFGTDVQLPSKGLLYGGKVPDGNVKVSPMTTREEKVLTAASGGEATYQIINAVFSRCISGLADLSMDDLLLGDRFYLLLVLRAVTFGKDYSFRINCTNCGQRNNQKIELPDDLDTVYLPDNFIEPIRITLPVSNAEVGLRLLRGKDEFRISKYLKKLNAKATVPLGIDPAYTYRLACQITDVKSQSLNCINETDNSHNQIMLWIDNLVGKDTAEIRQALTNADCGPSTELILDCQRCATPFTTTMPYDIEFFRPGSRRST